MMSHHSAAQDGECAVLYSTFVTPVITSLVPSEVTPGTEITVTGFSFGGADEVSKRRRAAEPPAAFSKHS